MSKVRKRSVPTTTPRPKICGILRRNSSEDIKKLPRRSVGFVDDIGKPLVDYRYLPPVEYANDDYPPHQHHHQKTSGRYMHHEAEEQQKKPICTKWQLLPVKMDRKRREKTEMTRLEEERLETMHISRAPLFGTFETIDSLHLIPDAIIRARAPVINIPLGTEPATSSANNNNNNNTYEQLFEESTEKPSKDILGLMAQLKQRGLIPGDVEEQQQKVARKSRWGQIEWKPDTKKPCTYFINRPDGCHHGDECKYEHNEELRAQRQLDIQNQNNRKQVENAKNAWKKDDSWRRRSLDSRHHQNRNQNRKFDENRRRSDGNRRKSRSRSPATDQN